MTITQIQTHGLTLRNEHGDPAKIEYMRRTTAARFLTLPWVLEARGINLRSAHKRWLRRAGLPLRSTKH